MTATGCTTIARLYLEMAKTSDEIGAILWGNSARRWFFYARVTRRLGRQLTFHEEEQLYERCCHRDLKEGQGPHGFVL